MPLATYTGLERVQAALSAGELADRDGSCLPFAVDKASASRAAATRALDRRAHKSGADHQSKVEAVVTALLADRPLLAEDAEIATARAPPRGTARRVVTGNGH